MDRLGRGYYIVYNAGSLVWRNTVHIHLFGVHPIAIKVAINFIFTYLAAYLEVFSNYQIANSVHKVFKAIVQVKYTPTRDYAAILTCMHDGITYCHRTIPEGKYDYVPEWIPVP